MSNKFNSKYFEKLNNPNRLKDVSPSYIWEKLQQSECSAILDIGAGTGLFSKAFLNLMDGGTVFAADISVTMVNWMKDNLCENYKGIVPILMEENSIDLSDQSVDLVLMFSLYHELSDPEQLLKESLRVLKNGGKICIVDWKKEKTTFGPPIEERYLIEDIEKHLKNSGFADVNADNSLKLHNVLWATKKK